MYTHLLSYRQRVCSHELFVKLCGHRFWECLWAVLVMSNDPIITAGLKTAESTIVCVCVCVCVFPDLSADRSVCVRTVLVLHCVWQLKSVERCVYLIGSPSFTSSCTRTCHKDRQEMCSGTSSCVLSFTLSLTEIRTAESLRQQTSLCVCSGHYILLKLLCLTESVHLKSRRVQIVWLTH